MTRRAHTGGDARTGRRREQGSSVVEVVILVPALGLFLALIVAGGRLAVAHQAVEASAAQAARSASLARTPTDARAAATTGATASLDAQHLRCTRTRVSLDTTGFDPPVGTPASVTATVSCTVDLADLSVLPGLPGQVTITATVESPLDTYRERHP